MKKNSNNLSKPSKTIIAGVVDPVLRGHLRRSLVDAEASERRAKMAKIRTAREVEAPTE
jgi:hypothetical protein